MIPWTLARSFPAGLAAALALLAAAEALWPAPAPPPAVALQIHQAQAAPTTNPFSTRDVTIILARPLFRPTRRPVAVAVAAAAPVDDTLPRLSAIIVTGAGRSALFDGGNGAPTAVSVGGSIGAYQVFAISPDSVGLSGPNGNVQVHPQFTGTAGSGTPAAPGGATNPDGLPYALPGGLAPLPLSGRLDNPP
jgi:hypothetical protein